MAKPLILDPAPPPAHVPPRPIDWIHVAAGTPNYIIDIIKCASLIIDSTTASFVNANVSPSQLRRNVERGRTVLWLRHDKLVTIAFHTFDGPTLQRGSHEKYCVCAGIDGTLVPVLPPPPPPPSLPADDPTYRSILDAIAHFANGNKGPNRQLYLLAEEDYRPEAGDRIYLFFKHAVETDVVNSERGLNGGKFENYPQNSTPTGAKPRWPRRLRTWKLK